MLDIAPNPNLVLHPKKNNLTTCPLTPPPFLLQSTSNDSLSFSISTILQTKLKQTIKSLDFPLGYSKLLLPKLLLQLVFFLGFIRRLISWASATSSSTPPTLHGLNPCPHRCQNFQACVCHFDPRNPPHRQVPGSCGSRRR